MNETDKELRRLRCFQDQMYVMLNRYIDSYLSPRDGKVLRAFKKDLEKLAAELWPDEDL
jgi:hypothetical protein